MISLFIEPIGSVYLNNMLFSEEPPLNRDDCLRPLIRMREALQSRGMRVNTVDCFLRGEFASDRNIFVSMGGLDYWERLKGSRDISLEAFFLSDCPLVYEKAYLELKTFAPHFRRIYSYSTGPGLEKYLPPGLSLEKIYWSLPYDDVDDRYWRNAGRKFITAIIANKEPPVPGQGQELYSERIRAVSYFARHGGIDLYGMGWDKPRFPKKKFRLKWFFDIPFRKAYRGVAASKYATLSGYTFAVCYENMILEGWVTEKVFDCLHAGTIPIYLGAPDISDHLPAEAFIDFRKFSSYDDLHRYLHSLSGKEIRSCREAGKDFFRSEGYRRFSSQRYSELFLDICANA